LIAAFSAWAPLVTFGKLGISREKQHSEENGQQLSDIAMLRQRARQDMEEGTVTGSYAADRDTVLRLLNEALATEIVCTLRYRACCGVSPLRRVPNEHYVEKLCGAISLSFSGDMP
jgi:hypothetical protein